MHTGVPSPQVQVAVLPSVHGGRKEKHNAGRRATSKHSFKTILIFVDPEHNIFMKMATTYCI